MAKPKQKNNTLIKYLAIFTLVVVTGYAVVYKTIIYNNAANLANVTQTRELITLASDGRNKKAPVDAPSGNVYFPQSRLFVTRPDILFELTYYYQPAMDGNKEELSVSVEPTYGSSPIYSAKNMLELYSAVPKYQACNRGVRVVYDKITDQKFTLNHTVDLNNGKKVYLYSEKSCPELSTLADVLTNLKSY
ncbi:MAG: hypothetical protein WCO19_03725 [Candidatus Saccharibacteria bacterium]